MKNEIYHFTNASRSNLLEFALQVNSLGATLCFDLEDLFMDPGTESGKVPGSIAEKHKIIDSIRLLAANDNAPAVGIRVNPLSSDELNDDIALLQTLPPEFQINAIFLPKISSPGDLSHFIRLVRLNRIPVRQIIPIIETKEAFGNIETVLKIKSELFTRIAFGHCDFNYSLGIFPFCHQSSARYWEWIKDIQTSCLKHHIRFINSPCLHLKEASPLLHTIAKLDRLFPEGYGQVTLSLFQTKLFHEAWNSILPKAPLMNDGTTGDVNIFAQNVVEQYRAHKRDRTSMAINNAGILIAPQEYLAACRHLEQRRIQYAK